MKKISAQNVESCANCLTCEIECASAFYKTEDKTKFDYACLHVIQKDGKTKIVTCVQCGKCAKTCENQAITQNKFGVYMIDKKKCTNCGKCVEACPFHVMVKAPDKEFPSKCIACGICVKACPQNVLYIKQDEAAAA